jgi:hypothetical protein
MDRQENIYKYSQLEVYKETLEVAHLYRKTIIVNILLVLFSGLLFYFLLGKDVPSSDIMPSIFILGVMLLTNFLLMSILDDLYNNLHIAMYVTIIGIYVVTTSLVFKFQTPSIFTVLFLGYAITSIYQDQKGMILSSFLLLFSGAFIVLKYPQFLSLQQQANTETLFIFVFVAVFIVLLTISSFILIKRKTFFYNQIASIKESEIRNIALMNKTEEIKTGHKQDFSNYYKDLNEFSKQLSKKIGVESLFSRRIEVLKKLRSKTAQEISHEFPEFTLSEIESLKKMELEVNKKMINLAVKASKSGDIKVSRKDIFSESQFKSFNHIGDSNYTKIISFAVFYTLLKIDKPYLGAIDEKLLKDMIFNSEYFYRIDRDIVNIYLENSEVFETIVSDHLKGGW